MNVLVDVLDVFDVDGHTLYLELHRFGNRGVVDDQTELEGDFIGRTVLDGQGMQTEVLDGALLVELEESDGLEVNQQGLGMAEQSVYDGLLLVGRQHAVLLLIHMTLLGLVVASDHQLSHVAQLPVLQTLGEGDDMLLVECLGDRCLGDMLALLLLRVGEYQGQLALLGGNGVFRPLLLFHQHTVHLLYGLESVLRHVRRHPIHFLRGVLLTHSLSG